MIKGNNIYFEYKRNEEVNKVLEDFNIHVKKGEFVVIMGHNGSGKSTFAKLTNGIIIPKEGELFINGLDIKDEENIWDIRETAGMIFQNPDNQIVATIIEEDIAFGPENLGVKSEEIKERIDRVLKIVGMEGYKKRPPHMLSGGQKQRIAIAGVLAMHPKCMVLDEPTAMLDPSGRKEVIDIIYKLNKEENITIVLITHNMKEAINADRIIVIDEGKIKLEGTPREVFYRYNEMRELGLDVPEVVKLSLKLKESGYDIGNVLTIEEMVDKLCQLK